VKSLSLRTSLTLAYTAMLALLVSALGYGYHRLLVGQLDDESTAVLEDMTRGLHGYLRFSEGTPMFEYDPSDPEAVTFIEEATRYYQVYDANTGRLLAQSPALESLGLRYTPDEVSAFLQNPGIEDLQTDRGRLRLQSSLIAPAEGQRYLLQVGEPLDRFDRAITNFERLLVWRLIGGLIAAALIGYWMAGRALAPLSRLARATRAIDIRNLQERVAVRGTHDELDEVAHALNHALERVEHAMGEMRQFSAALAHELRTPLAILRGESELALTQALSPEELRQRLAVQLDEFDKLTRLINQILTLARAEAGEIALANAPVDFAVLTTSTVDQLEAVAEARGIRLSCDASRAVVVHGDAGWLERLLLILLDNAIKFTPPEGTVWVRVSEENGSARLDVRDSGPGIPSESLPHIFERFYRVDPARSRQTEGAGLGLALAKWIVEHHGGTIQVASSEGHGSTFTVWLPSGPANAGPYNRRDNETG
jgi:heavy metal sensor kinase